MRKHLIVAITVCTLLFLPARQMRETGNPSTYSHGEKTCLPSDEGPGMRLRLRPSNRCEERVSYPYLEVDIRELPIVAQKTIAIGEDNWAFKCADPKESCEQSRGGTIVFDHLEGTVGKDNQIDGSYHLRFRTAGESGHFKVDCRLPCD